MVDQLKLDDLQSYGELFAPALPPQAPRGEHRHSDRKATVVDGMVVVDGAAIPIKTVDLSTGGVAIRSSRQLAVGKEYQLSLELPVNAAAHAIDARVQVIYAFFTANQDFKVGLEFLEIVPSGADRLRQFLSA